MSIAVAAHRVPAFCPSCSHRFEAIEPDVTEFACWCPSCHRKTGVFDVPLDDAPVAELEAEAAAERAMNPEPEPRIPWVDNSYTGGRESMRAFPDDFQGQEPHRLLGLGRRGRAYLDELRRRNDFDLFHDPGRS